MVDYQAKLIKALKKEYGITVDEVIAVWFSKEIQNAKGMFIIDSEPLKDFYYEVTYNGDKNETYIDRYLKIEHSVVADSELE